MNENWTMIESMFGVLTILIGAGFAYIRLFISNELKALKLELLSSLTFGFYNREMVDTKLNELFARISVLEERDRLRK